MDITSLQNLLDVFNIDAATLGANALIVVFVVEWLKGQFLTEGQTPWLTGWKTTVAVICVSILTSLASYGVGNIAVIGVATLGTWMAASGGKRLFNKATGDDKGELEALRAELADAEAELKALKEAA